MNQIRKLFAEEVEALAPVLHETYRRIDSFRRTAPTGIGVCSSHNSMR